MNYSLNRIISAADCDALLTIAGLDRKDLEFKKLQQERQYESVNNGASSIEADLLAVETEIQVSETVIATLPDGSVKAEFEDRLDNLQHKRNQLIKRREKYGTIGLMQKEYAISCFEQQLAETDAYINDLSRRKAEL